MVKGIQNWRSENGDQVRGKGKDFSSSPVSSLALETSRSSIPVGIWG